MLVPSEFELCALELCALMEVRVDGRACPGAARRHHSRAGGQPERQVRAPRGSVCLRAYGGRQAVG